MSEDKEVTTRITESDRDKLNNLSSKYGMKASVILGYIIDQAIKYNTLEAGWEGKLAEDKLADYLKDADLEFRKKVELLNIKAQISAKTMVFKNWMDILPPSEKRQFLENVMGARKGEDFLEQLANYQMYLIDGLKKLYPPEQDGYPSIPWISKVDIIKCLRGFHIANNRCDCRYWDSCEHGKAQYENWLAAHGSQQEQRRYLEETTGQHYYRRSS